MYLYIVLGGFSVQSCCTLPISASYHYLFMAHIENPELFVCGSDLDLSQHQLLL